MKNKISVLLLLLFCATAFSISILRDHKQTRKPTVVSETTYDSYWNKVDSLAKKGLNRSALETVMKIYSRALAENNPTQLLKAVIHRIKFTSYTEEDDVIKSIADLKMDCAKAPFPASAILHSMLAETYWNFYGQNRWKFMNRTETIDFKNDDINTWDLKKIFEQTVGEYRRSLDEQDREMKIQVNVFDDILEKGKPAEARNFRPTLYDFLAHRALDFYMNEEPGLTQPADKYHIDAAWYLNDVDMFLNFGLIKEDTLNLKYNAILILQDLLRFHLNDTHPGALIDVNLKRLKFVYNELTISNKDTLYVSVLQRLAYRYREYPGSTDALYEIAQLYYNKGNGYSAGDSDDIRLMKRRAESVCDSAIESFPYSQGGLNCKHLKGLINEKFISSGMEKVNIPGRPILGSVRYMNINKVFARITRMDPHDEEKRSGLYGERLVNYYLGLPLQNAWDISLPDDSDKQTHTAEFEIPALPPGKYALLLSGDKQFTFDKNSVAYTTFWVSNLSFINRRGNTGYEIYVLDRTSGMPMPNVQATVYTSQYNYASRKYESKKGNTSFTDANGRMELEGDADQRNYSLELVSGSDQLFLNDNLYLYTRNQVKQFRYVTYFFTDRSIYRPGQTVYFKGIVLETDGDSSRIKPGFKTTVGFYDANSQKISDREFTTNEYGTFSGSFTAPTGVLTGNMRIQNESGTCYFSVEEYKRPKFEVTFEPVKGSYLVNNRISVTLKANSYSGTHVGGAQVKYRVTRTAQIPDWFYYWRGYIPSSPETEITNGNTVTDENGNAVITFDALADEKLSKESNPVFDFLVSADVTDINGETHTGTQNISAGYKSLFIETDLGDKVNRDEWKSFTIQSRNMAGNFEPANGTVTVYRLPGSGKLFRERLLEAPDRHTLSREEFEKKFPFDIYEDEKKPSGLTKEAQVFSRDFDTGKDSIVSVSDGRHLKQGNYAVEIKSSDKYGHDVQYFRYFTLFSIGEKDCPVDSFASFIPLKTKGEPGEKARFLIGSADDHVKLLYEVELKDNIISRQWLTLDHSQKLVEIPIEESHRGNFAVHFTFVRQNRFYKFDQVVNVPWSNREIGISLETFRDKLKPGAKEEWRLKLTGKFSEKISAEILASMYDASLDAFLPHRWMFNPWHITNSMLSFQSGTMFSSVSSASFGKNRDEIPPLKFRTYDALNWFGYAPNGRRYFAAPMMDHGGIAMEAMESRGQAAKAEDSESSREEVSSFSVIPDSKNLTQSSGSGKLPVQPRTNFSETAFFYPALVTNEKNEVVFSFTMPEALTRWKFMALAHTRNLEFGLTEKELITQKELMVIPNPPRFLREGDTLTFPCRIANLADTSLTGTARLALYDPLTGASLTPLILKGDSSLPFYTGKGGNSNVGWRLIIPEGISAINFRVTAETEKFTDGESQVIPVLTNRMLVTESMPLWANANQTKTFSFDKFSSNTSTTLRNHKLTLEFTSNPAWYAVQALPYLMEYPYACSEQVFSRYYANALASHIANSNPKIREVFEAWKTSSPESFLSNLEKNQELKTAILEQTPWLLDARDESERKKRIALLFDLNKMSNEMQNALLQLQQKQHPDGSWSWFDGMPDDRYITQYIVEGSGHLDHLGVASVHGNENYTAMLQRAIAYLDGQLEEDYSKLVASKADLTKNNLSQLQVHYLYARSFFRDLPADASFRKAFDYFLSQEKKFWLDRSSEYMQGMMALTLFRNSEKTPAMDIMKSLKENSQYNEELGRYWKNNSGGYTWGLASIETQSILVEAFHEVADDKEAVNEMQRWLLKNKETNDWKTTKATAEACYALLLGGMDFLSASSPAAVTVGGEKINPEQNPDMKTEAGTGYFKISWTGGDIKPSMGEVIVENKNSVPAWGAMYWQYFEQLDKITRQETPLKLQKQIFIEQLTPSGKIIAPVTGQMRTKVSDRLIARIELRVDRDMEYVMMKDMRASGLEPENVLSTYKWQDGLGYYESTHDASTDFFFSYLPKGTYVFEYPLRASQEGTFSNGITTIQCMYAPGFGSHSEGTILRIGQ